MARIYKPQPKSENFRALSLTELQKRRRAIKARIEWLEKRDRQIAAEMSRRVQSK